MNKRRIPAIGAKFGVFALIASLVFPTPLGLAQEMKASGKQSAKPAANTGKTLTPEQRALHILDRASFGPRPGDVDRVMQLGWERYLEEQLRPERISDQALEGRLKNIESIHLSAAEMAKYYPQPQQIREALKAKGIELPGEAAQTKADTKALRKDLKQSSKADAEKMASDAQPEQVNGQGQKVTADQIAKRQEYVRALQELGYRPPQQAIMELQQAKLLRAAYSERQLQEVMTDFWFNHFNVFAQKGADKILTTSYERDVIRPHAFDKFEDLLRATAESPAMLWYLDNWMSVAPNARGTQMLANMDQLRQMRRNNANNSANVDPARMDELRAQRRQMMRDQMRNQNGEQSQPGQMQPGKLGGGLAKRARGLNENYAREIMELHTLGVEGGYTQMDVTEVARCFTGWTLRQPRAGAEFVFNPMMHDDGEKLVLGHKIPAGGGKRDGEMVLHILATQPATAKFVATKLARKFVSDNPPAALIDRMAQTFSKTNGDTREVLRTMFKSPEFWAAESYNAKIKTPFEMTVSAVRAIGAETNGGPQFHRWLAQMGEGLFLAQPPTGYPDTAEHWVNTGALLERMNFALALAGNQIRGTRVDLNRLTPAGATSAQDKVVDQYVRLLLRGDVSPQTRATIDKNLREQQLAANNAPVDVARVVGLILGSPEFQRQ